MSPEDEPDGKDSSGKLAMEEVEVLLETKFPAKERVVEPEDIEYLAKPTKSEVTNRLKPVKRPE